MQGTAPGANTYPTGQQTATKQANAMHPHAARATEYSPPTTPPTSRQRKARSRNAATKPALYNHDRHIQRQRAALPTSILGSTISCTGTPFLLTRCQGHCMLLPPLATGHHCTTKPTPTLPRPTGNAWSFHRHTVAEASGVVTAHVLLFTRSFSPQRPQHAQL